MTAIIGNSGSISSLNQSSYLIGIGKGKWVAKPEGPSSFYFPDFFLKNPKPWRVHESYREIGPAALQDLEKHEAVQWKPVDRQVFDSEFLKLQRLFKEDALQKAVLYVMAKGKGTISVPHVLRSMLRFAGNNAVFIYGWWDKNKGMLGATPEILLEINGDQLSTMACAGTCRKDQNVEHFLADEKELQEHQLVIRSIQESLSPFGQVSIGERKLLSLTHLSHLVTPIKSQLKSGWQLDSLVESLHPTPALGSYPKKNGNAWLRDYDEKMPRGQFGAPAGIIDGDCTKLYVAIRNVQWDGDDIQIGVGCGILPESVADKEWEELQAKLSLVKEMLQI